MSIKAISFPTFSPLATARDYFNKKSDTFAAKVTGDWTERIIKGAKVGDALLVLEAIATGASAFYIAGLILVGVALHLGSKQIEKLKKLSGLDKQVTTLTEENVKLSKVREDLQGEVKNLGVENEKFRKENGRLTKIRKGFKKENRKLANTNRALTVQVARFKELSERLDGQLNTLHTENATLSQTNLSLQDKLTQLNAFATRIQRDFEVERERLAAAGSFIEATGARLDGSVTDLSDRFTRNLAELERIITIINTDKVALTSQLASINESLIATLKLEPLLRASIAQTEAVDQKAQKLFNLLEAAFNEDRIKELMDRALKLIANITKLEEDLLQKNIALHAANVEQHQRLAGTVDQLVKHQSNNNGGVNVSTGLNNSNG